MQVQRLGLVEYVPTWQLQEELMAATVAIKTHNRQAETTGAAPQPTPNHLLLCEHPHTYTLGKSGKPEHLLLDEAALAAHGASFHRINRGGDITYHGPGQLVGYPILDLDNFRPDIHWYLRTLEEAVIRTLAEYGLNAGRIAGLTGVWLDWEAGAAQPPQNMRPGREVQPLGHAARLRPQRQPRPLAISATSCPAASPTKP